MAAISTGTTPLYTAQHPGWNYEPIAYDMHELPQPLPARNDLLPWERKERTEQERHTRQYTETQRAYDNAARQKARGGFFNNLSASVKPRWAKWRTTPMPVRESIPSKRDERRFNNKFHFPSYERLLYASELCKTVAGSQQILGKVYIGENFFCFRESRLQPKGGRRQRLLLVIPIEDILSIAQSEIASQPDPRHAPEFRVLEQWHAKADGIFLYTRDMKVHRFYGFWTQQTFHDTFNVLDRQWRTRPYASTTPLRAGEPSLSRSMVPPVGAAAPSVAVLEPSQFQPDYGTRSLSSSVLRTAPPYAAPALAASTAPFASSMRQSSSQLPVQAAPMSSSFRSSTFVPPEQSGFSGNTAQYFPSRSASGMGMRSLPHTLQNDIRHSSVSRLRHVGSPTVRYGHAITEIDGRLQLIPIASLGSDAPRSFGLTSQGRQFRRPHYMPKQQQQRQQEQWQQQQWPQQQEQWQQPQWQQRSMGSSYQQRRHIPTQLANEIRGWDRHQLHHVAQPEYHAGTPLGHVVDSRRSWQPQQQQQQRSGFMQRDRIGFQTVQQKLHTSQRGRRLAPQLQDEIHYFNLRSLRHVTPIVRTFVPQAADVKMRPMGERSGERRHHHHHRGHKHQRSERGASDEMQVFQYEEYDLSSPNKFEHVQVTKFQEPLQAGATFIPTTGARTFETGTA